MRPASTVECAVGLRPFIPTSCHADSMAAFSMAPTIYARSLSSATTLPGLCASPVSGAICREYADEKIAMEVEVLSLVRERTTIPVPKVYSWGLAVDNPLGLGAFILMEFIDGTSVNRLLKDPTVNSRLVREDISDSDIEFLYRQISRFQLQLFELDFDRIGSLPTPKTGFSAPIRPLTWKVHDIIQTGGVNTFGTAPSCLFYTLALIKESVGDRTQGFSNTTEYFDYIMGQDCEQLAQQLNSVAGPYDAEKRYTSYKTLASLTPGYVNEQYNEGPFKLICDDLGLANLIVKREDDLTVVGVVDLEWSYVGPVQLFASAPWWLLQDRPINPQWDCDDNEPPDIAPRYFKYLEIYKRVLEDEEAKRPGHEKKEVSRLVKWSETSGAMWLHILLSNGFNDTYSFPFVQLRQHVGIDTWEKLRSAVNADEVKTFVEQKVLHLEQYEVDLKKIEADKTCVDCGVMTRGEFLEQHCPV